MCGAWPYRATLGPVVVWRGYAPDLCNRVADGFLVEMPTLPDHIREGS